MQNRGMDSTDTRIKHSDPKHSSQLVENLCDLWNEEFFCDCSLVAEGKTVNAHRVILSAASPYFKKVLSASPPIERPILIFEKMTFENLQNTMKFVYEGEVTLEPKELSGLLEALEFFNIKTPTESQLATRVFSSLSATVDSVMDEPLSVFPKVEMKATKRQQMFEEDSSDSSELFLKTRFKKNKRFRPSSKTGTKRTNLPRYVNDDLSEISMSIKKNAGPSNEPPKAQNIFKSVSKVRQGSLPSRSNEPASICDFCEKQFYNRRTGMAHSKTCKMNPNRERFICLDCGLELARKDCLKNHKNRIHSEKSQCRVQSRL